MINKAVFIGQKVKKNWKMTMQGYFDQVRGNTICIVRVLRCVSGSQGGLVTEFTQIPLRAVF